MGTPFPARIESRLAAENRRRAIIRVRVDEG